MEHKTVIVHLILNNLNHINISVNTQNMHFNCAINWFESTNIMNRLLFVMKTIFNTRLDGLNGPFSPSLCCFGLGEAHSEAFLFIVLKPYLLFILIYVF